MMATKQTRIYAPHRSPYDNNLWAETMMARIIKPLVGRTGVKWVWVTRYAFLTLDFSDSDGSKAPEGFFEKPLYRSLRFRYEIEPERQDEFEAAGAEIVKSEGCWQADWRDFPVDSLSGDRFLGSPRTDERRREREGLVMNYVDSVTRLALHALIPADDEGRFKIEDNDHHENPHNSAFFSLHHLFCNTTNVLLTALINCQPENLQGGTLQYPPQDFQRNPNHPCSEFQVRF
jgi:hypothetical protein